MQPGMTVTDVVQIRRAARPPRVQTSIVAGNCGNGPDSRGTLRRDPRRGLGWIGLDRRKNRAQTFDRRSPRVV